jgi:transcriptional regulator with XRE-family HTH domain
MFRFATIASLIHRIAPRTMTQTIGQRLKAEREEQRLTLEKVFQATRIRVQYLQALEEDDLSIMPSPVQARGYLRNYAEYLGFDVEQLLQELREMNTQSPASEVIGPADISRQPQPEEKAPEPAVVETLQTLESTQVEPVEEQSFQSNPSQPDVRNKMGRLFPPPLNHPPGAAVANGPNWSQLRSPNCRLSSKAQ